MSADPSKLVLMIDDDPSHLKVYAWVLQRGGFDPHPLLVTSRGISLPAELPIQVVVMDYRLGLDLSAVKIAQEVRSAFPRAPIIILSDVVGMPSDIAPFAEEFVRKGEPEELLRKVSSLLPA